MTQAQMVATAQRSKVRIFSSMLIAFVRRSAISKQEVHSDDKQLLLPNTIIILGVFFLLLLLNP